MIDLSKAMGFIVVPVEYQSLIEAVSETKAKTIKEMLTQDEIETVRNKLKELIKSKPRDIAESYQNNLARTYISILPEISAQDALGNIIAMINNKEIVKKLRRYSE